NPSTGTPVGACITVALMAALFLLKYAGVAYIAIAASGMIYLSYLLANLAILRARRRGVLARALGHCGQRAGARVGWRDADQLRLAPRRHQPEVERDRRAAALPRL